MTEENPAPTETEKVEIYDEDFPKKSRKGLRIVAVVVALIVIFFLGYVLYQNSKAAKAHLDNEKEIQRQLAAGTLSINIKNEEQ